MHRLIPWIGAAVAGLIAYFVAPSLPFIGVAILSAFFFLGGYYVRDMKF